MASATPPPPTRLGGGGRRAGARACLDKAQLVREGRRFTALMREAVASTTAPSDADRAPRKGGSGGSDPLPPQE